MDEILSLLKDLVEINSVSGNEKEICLYVRDWFEDNDIEVEMQRVENERWNVIARVSGEGSDKKVLILSGHLDTVPPVDNWETDPFKLEIKNGKAYGLGALDMKSGVAILMSIMKEMKNSAKNDLWCVLTVDEELISMGMWKFLEEYVKDNEFYAALFTEPLPGDKIAVVNKCFGRFAVDVRLTLEGGHAAYSGNEKVIEEIRGIAKALEKLENFRKKGVIGECEYVLSFLEMGSEFLSAPSSCNLRLNHKAIEGETLETTIKEVKDAFSEFECEVKPMERKTPFLEPFLFENEFVDLCLSIVGGKAETSPSVFDGNMTAMKGITTINIGPVGENIHKANEYVLIDSIYKVRNYVKEIIERA